MGLYDEKPDKLADQILYEMKQSAQKAITLLAKTPYEIKYNPDVDKHFKECFIKIGTSMCAKMGSKLNNKGKPLDAHKVASIAVLTVLKSKPLYCKVNNEKSYANLINEVVAYLLAGMIIRNFQIHRFSNGNNEKANKIRNKLGSFETPEIITDDSTVSLNTFYAFSFLSRTLDFSDAVDVSWIVSSLYFYIDSYNQKFVKELSDVI